MDKFAIILAPENLLLFWDGLWATLNLLVLSLAAGAALTLPLTLMRVSRHAWLSKPVWFFTYVLRGTPLLIQVYFIYYGIAQLEWVQSLWDTVWPWTWFKDPLFCIVLAFTLNTCAYTVEMLAGAIRETPVGEIEAAKAAGYSNWGQMRHIILPSAMRRTLPGYSNEVIMMLHSTSLASIVPALYDLMNAANILYKKYYLPFQSFIVVGVIYLCLTFLLVLIFRALENRYLAYLRPRGH